jgi:thiamine pyrophosphate-dependent acetolactate synthase large subunit-like protein
VIVDESVSANLTLVRALDKGPAENYFSTTGGSLGWGIGAAAGIALATNRPVTSVVGDGAFFFGVQSLWPIAARRLPVTVIVLDNGGFGSTRWFEEKYVRDSGDPSRSAHAIGADFSVHGPDALRVGRGFDLTTFDVMTPDGIRLASDDGHAPKLVRIRV